MKTAGLVRASISVLAFLSIVSGVFGQATYHVPQSYEDTVRVAILWNDPQGKCTDATAPVGQRTRDTVLSSILRVGTRGIPAANIKLARTDEVTWAQIRQMWPGKLPHTIVHVNAGWVTYNVTGGKNSSGGSLGVPPQTGAIQPEYETFLALLDSATNNTIGIVEVGDDAAFLASRTFGFTGVQNEVAPMYDATGAASNCCPDSLWIGLWRANDDKLKTPDPANPGKLIYPYVNGVISNTVDSILRVPASPDARLFMKDYGSGRCQADADKYNVLYPSKITFLGYQQGFVSGNYVPAGTASSDFKTIVAIQDTTFQNGDPNWPIVRRAVALSFQPQWLRNRAAEQQIIYDAIMYTSLTNTIQIASRFSIVATSTTLVAGDTLPIKVYVINQFGKVQSDSVTINRLQWALDPAFPPIEPTDKIIVVKPDSARFTAIRANRVAHILISLRNSSVDTSIAITIIPASPCRLVIERKGTKVLWDPQFNLNLDTLKILSNETEQAAYSTVRDCYGNFIRYGKIFPWGSLDETVATVKAGDVEYGEGVATRNPTAVLKVTKIHALDTVTTLRDSCFVKLEDFYYEKLRIVIDKELNPDSLVMNTNQDTTIKAQGLRSSDKVWVDVPVIWQNKANLSIDPAGPANEVTWTFSPSDTGSGWIRATMNNDSKTIPDSVWVRFFPGPPVRASIDIITRPDSIIAGKPVQAVVRLYDKDGHSYTYSFDTTAGSVVTYRDTIGTGGLKFPPFIIVDGRTMSLAPTPTDSGNQTFLNGRDTVSFTLYYAPFDTTLKHQIVGNFIIGAGTITASSAPFVLHPEKLARITIVYPNDTLVPDTLHLTDPIVVISIGYDKYGNRIGDIIGTWSVTDSLHQITDPVNGSSITYDPRNVVKNEQGYIFVTRDGVKDSIYVIIAGQPVRLVRAVTRDISGNGILDRMELYFSRKFGLPANASFTGLTIIANGRDTLVVNRILNTGGNIDDSVWVVELVESRTNQPQTGWKPSVHLPFQSAYDLADITVVATDGAGPVVWRVVNLNVLPNSHEQDTVVVTFSEPVQRSDGGNLTLSDKPVDIFYVWTRDPAYPNDTSRFVLVRDMLAGTFLRHEPGRGNMLVFTMSNGNDLNSGHYLSLADSTNKYVSDTTLGAVRPNTNNIPRRVEVVPVQKDPYIPFNPIGPVFTREGPGIFNAANNENALTWVRDDRGRGAVIIVPVPLPPEGEKEAKLKFMIKIYDVIGNVVQSNENPDFLDPAKYGTGELKNQSGVDAAIYWNGSNEKGMAVAPGVYRVVMYLKYSGLSSANKNNYKDKRMIAKLGIQR